MTKPVRTHSLRSIRAALALVLLTTLTMLGAQLPFPTRGASGPPQPVAPSLARSDEIQRLEAAHQLSLFAPQRAIPALAGLTEGAEGDDVRLRAGELLLDSLTRSPSCASLDLEPALRTIYINAEDDQLRQRALLFLLARQLDELPEGGRGAFLKAILPQVLRSARRHQLPPSITLAQAVLESGWGRSTLAREHHNLFGVKAGSQAPAVALPTREQEGGGLVQVQARFRSFSSVDESIEHHARLLGKDRRYAQARTHASDWRAFLERLAPTYATDPAYAQRLATLVERYELDRWDSLVGAGARQDHAG